MLLSEYLSDLVKVIDEYSKTNYIVNFELKTDFRTGKIGIIRGSVAFSDNSKLIFTEYLDLRFKIEKLSYSFHYQKEDSALIFRYDNALHKPAVDFAGHKHLSNGKVVPAEPPAFNQVLSEVIDLLL